MKKNMGWLLACLLASPAVWADGVHRGTEIPFRNMSSGKPAITLMYAYDVDWGWTLTFASRLKSEVVEALPAQLFWTLATPGGRSATGVYRPFVNEALVVGSVRIDDPAEVRKILTFPQSDLDFVVSRDAYGEFPLYYISLHDLCTRLPSHVSDLSQSGNPACVVRLDP